jgi:hypothetical protein
MDDEDYAKRVALTTGQLVTAIFFRFSGHREKVLYNISKECSASIFRVTELVKVDAEVAECQLHNQNIRSPEMSKSTFSVRYKNSKASPHFHNCHKNLKTQDR